MVNFVQRLRRPKLVDLLRAVSVVDLIFFIFVAILVPSIVLSKPDSNKGGGKNTDSNVPKIYELSPDSGPIGTKIVIVGINFTDNNSIKIKGKVLLSDIPSLEDGTKIEFTLPEDAPCNPPSACPLKVVVANGQGESNAYPFKMTWDTTPAPSPTPNGSSTPTPSPTATPTPSPSPSPSPSPTPTPSPSPTPPPTPSPASTSSASPSPTSTPSPTPTPVPITDISVSGRLVNEFTGESVLGARVYAANLDLSPDPYYTDQDGRFFLSTDVTHLIAPTYGGAWPIYTPSCYFYAVSIDVLRYQPGVMTIYPEGNVMVSYRNLVSPKIYFPVISSPDDTHRELGDLQVRPGTNIIITSDIEVKFTTDAQISGMTSTNGIANYTTYYNSGSRIIPFNMPMRIILTDRSGNTYNSPYFTADYNQGCNTKIYLDFNNGEFTINQQ